MRFGRGGLILAAVAALAFAAAVWALTRHPEPVDSLARARENGVIRIGYAVEAPYAFVAADGRVTGIDPELARLVADRIGIKRIEWVQTRFGALISDLEQNRFDMIAAGLFVTPERSGRVAFSAPSLQVRAGLLVRAGNPKNLRSYSDAAADQTARIAVVAGSVEEERLAARGLTAERLQSVADADAGRAAVESGSADALALSLPTLRWMAKTSDGALEAVAVAGRRNPTDPIVPFRVAFAFPPKQTALVRTWTAAMAEVLGSPEHLRIVAPFGIEADDLKP